MIIGDFDSLSDAAMHCGAQLIHHVHPDGRAPGRENLRRRGRRVRRVRRRGDERGRGAADRIRSRRRRSSSRSARTQRWSSSSTRAAAAWRRRSSTRLRLGPALVDAKGVSRLVRGPDPAARHGVPRRVGDRRDGRDGLRIALAARLLRRLPVDVQRRLGADRELVLTGPGAVADLSGFRRRRPEPPLGSPCSP